MRRGLEEGPFAADMGIGRSMVRGDVRPPAPFAPWLGWPNRPPLENGCWLGKAGWFASPEARPRQIDGLRSASWTKSLSPNKKMRRLWDPAGRSTRPRTSRVLLRRRLSQDSRRATPGLGVLDASTATSDRRLRPQVPRRQSHPVRPRATRCDQAPATRGLPRPHSPRAMGTALRYRQRWPWITAGSTSHPRPARRGLEPRR